MGFILEPHCRACNHKWPRATIGDSRRFVCNCPNCNNIVNPERAGFTNILRCEVCDSSLDCSCVIDVFNMRVDKEGFSKCSVPCPRCGEAKLNFPSVMHFSMGFKTPTPREGEIVHGQFEDGELSIPGMYCIGCDLSVNDLPSDHNGRPMELLTDKLEVVNGEPRQIVFRFRKFLGDGRNYG